MEENKKIKEAVLSEFGRLVPNFTDSHLLNPLMGIRRSLEQCVLFEWQHEGLSHPTSVAFTVCPDAREDSPIWEIAHRLLGLDARDKVAELQFRFDSALETLGAKLLKDGEEIGDLKAKTAALVEALEAIAEKHGYQYSYGGSGFGNVTDKRLNSTGVAINAALEAHRKGEGEGV